MPSKKRLPIPLILLIPILLLIGVIGSGVYHTYFTNKLSLAKLSSSSSSSSSTTTAQSKSEVTADPIVHKFLNLDTQLPWAVKVPEESAIALITKSDTKHHYISGNYVIENSSAEGAVLIPTQWIKQQQGFILAPFIVTGQGSGVFYYIGLFQLDEQEQQVHLVSDSFLGDRITIDDLAWSATNKIQINFRQHGAKQAFSDEPNQKITSSFNLAATKLVVEK